MRIKINIFLRKQNSESLQHSCTEFSTYSTIPRCATKQETMIHRQKKQQLNVDALNKNFKMQEEKLVHLKGERDKSTFLAEGFST